MEADNQIGLILDESTKPQGKIEQRPQSANSISVKLFESTEGGEVGQSTFAKNNFNGQRGLTSGKQTLQLYGSGDILLPQDQSRSTEEEPHKFQFGKRRNCCLSFCFYLKLACQSIKRKKCQFILAFLACFVVVLVTLVANTVLANGALIFFSTAQGNVGQKDMILTNSAIASIAGSDNLVNATRVNQVLSSRVPGYPGAPRITNINAFLCTSHCQTAERATEAQIVALDTGIEKSIGFGSRFPFSSKMQEGECQVSSNHARRFNLEVGSTAHLQGSYGKYWQTFEAEYNYTHHKEVQVQNILYLQCKVSGIYDNTGGRDSDGTKDAIYMEMSSFLKSVEPYIQLKTPDAEFNQFLRVLRTEDYVTSVILNFKDPRIKIYMNSDYNEIQYDATSISSDIVESLGFFPVKMDLPILQQLKVLSLGSVFFGIILSLVVVLLATLSIMLIYSLLMVSIESKTFEIGVMRMIGVSKCSLICLLLTQAFTFVLPSVIMGFIVSFPILVAISNIFKDQVDYGFAPVPSGLSILYGLLLGFGIPIISALVPIRVALNKNLSDSLDYNRSRTQAVIYRIMKPSKADTLMALGFGIVAVVFGVCIYYFLPLAIVSFNFALLFNIFFGILIAMLVGFVLLALNAQHLLEIILVYLLLCWQRRSTKKIVLKNLTAHRLRNQKTSLMYALSLSFSIMIISAYTMQLKASELQELKNNGTHLKIGSGQDGVSLDWPTVKTAIAAYPQVVQDYSIASFPPTRMDNNYVTATVLSDNAKLANIDSNIYGVSVNLFAPMQSDFLKVHYRSNSALSLSQQLYTARGSQSFGSGYYAQKTAHNQGGWNSTIVLSIQHPTVRYYRLLHPIWSLDQAPGFSMGDRSSSWQSEHVAVSFPSYRKISNYTSVTKIPVERVFVKLSGGASQSDINSFLDQVRDTVSNSGSLSIFDYRDLKDTIQGVQSLLDTIFTLVLMIVMLLCFFSLVASMSANIMEQSKEIAVLRSLGITRNRVIFLYVYQAFILVMASSLLGLFIGTLVGWTMVLQRVLFVQLPLEFYFPYWQTLAVFLVAVLTAFASSCAPARSLLKKQIAQIIRSNA